MSTTVEHTILVLDAPVIVQAQQAGPGLYVYEVPDSVDVGAPCRWRVGHHSGLAVARFETAEAAHAGAEAVASWADWTCDADTVRQVGLDRPADERRAILWAVENTGGHLGNCCICG